MNTLEIDRILRKAIDRDLDVSEVRTLLHVPNHKPMEIIRVADKVKRKHFGKKIGFYVPLYFDSYCANDCLYCDFRKSNLNISRKKLSIEEFKEEVKYLDKQGYTWIELVSATDLGFSIDTLCEFVKYLKSQNKTVLMNNRPLTLEEYKRLKKAGLDWSWLWMESYDKRYYELYHPAGNEKADFKARLKSYDNMAKAGLNIGVAFLIGLSPHFEDEILATISHAKYLKEEYDIKIAFGTPRFCPPKYAPLKKVPYPEVMSDDRFRLMIALYRLAIGDCWINVSTREDIDMLEKLWIGGGNLTNPEVKTVPGGYTLKSEGAQFTHNSYSWGLFVDRIKKLGLEPI